MNDKVSFTAMEHGNREDYELVSADFAETIAGTADRVLQFMRMMDGPSPYRISRLDHCLQAATRAERDGADIETVVCALLHDIGDVIGPANHSQIAAALLRPYVSEKNYWIVLHHGLFQGYYYVHYQGMDRNARDRYRDHEHYQACVDFCHRWDQASFDPGYDTLPMEHFEPLVREIFARKTRGFL